MYFIIHWLRARVSLNESMLTFYSLTFIFIAAAFSEKNRKHIIVLFILSWLFQLAYFRVSILVEQLQPINFKLIIIPCFVLVDSILICNYLGLTL